MTNRDSVPLHMISGQHVVIAFALSAKVSEISHSRGGSVLWLKLLARLADYLTTSAYGRSDCPCLTKLLGNL